MKFISIELNNWLVFRGQQEILFPQDDHANILIIFGENMHGKTSLLNAVRWVLYGEALDRQKRVISNEKLLNIDAKSDGEKTLSVTLRFEDEGQSYEVLRTANINDDKINTSLVMKENNRVQDGGVSQSKIDGLVPKQISQFLLFDGELLNEFEQLVVDEKGQQASAIKRSIEKALGLPVLQRAVEELKDLQRNISKNWQLEAKKSRNLEVLVRNLGIHEGDLASKFEEKELLKKQIEETNIIISELDDKIEKSSKDLSLTERKKLLNEELAKNKKEIVDKENALKQAIASLWREPLCAALKPLVVKVETDIKVHSSVRRTAEVALGQIKELEKALEISLCSQCGSELATEQRLEIQSKLDGIKSSSTDTANLDRQIASLQAKLSGITFSGLETNNSIKIRSFSEARTGLLRRNIKIEDEIFEIRNDLADFDEENGRRIKNEFTVRNQEIGRLTSEAIIIDADIEKIEAEVKAIKKNPDYVGAIDGGETKTQLDTSEALLTIFNSAVSDYRDTMRKLVGERASETFEHLTTEKNFDYLEINQSYGLNLIVEGHRVARSAGAEQIVALSLIESLNFLGRRKGPMLMDTPAGRLDKSHRENVMNYLPQVVTQLAFFAHSGELTEDDIYFDRSKIGIKYKITRVTSFHSNLEVI
ncbi:AAA family ATPase [Ascidiaceihabitans sp.]|nr:AAA family ATPase [Ascidiaceihabitans sp.]